MPLHAFLFDSFYCLPIHSSCYELNRIATSDERTITSIKKYFTYLYITYFSVKCAKDCLLWLFKPEEMSPEIPKRKHCALHVFAPELYFQIKNLKLFDIVSLGVPYNWTTGESWYTLVNPSLGHDRHSEIIPTRIPTKRLYLHNALLQSHWPQSILRGNNHVTSQNQGHLQSFKPQVYCRIGPIKPDKVNKRETSAGAETLLLTLCLPPCVNAINLV